MRTSPYSQGERTYATRKSLGVKPSIKIKEFIYDIEKHTNPIAEEIGMGFG